MRQRTTIRATFGWITLAAGVFASFIAPDGIIWLAIVVIALIIVWPWMFGHGG
jgi:hypothetical protein